MGPGNSKIDCSWQMRWGLFSLQSPYLAFFVVLTILLRIYKKNPITCEFDWQSSIPLNNFETISLQTSISVYCVKHPVSLYRCDDYCVREFPVRVLADGHFLCVQSVFSGWTSIIVEDCVIITGCTIGTIGKAGNFKTIRNISQ